ncbi:MAG: phosphotransferase enzyme domain protein, partial [Acidimicrobiaceae bacterium]
VKDARDLLKDGYESQLSSGLWTLSPSDFGLHNSITTSSNDLVFFDFEYFGWDDPVKVTVDFCLHPAMSLDLSSQKYWVSEMKALFAHDSRFELRLKALAPLYAIRWALIILNEFRSDKLKNRLHAQSTIHLDIRNKQVEQLEKAKLMIANFDRPIF